MNYLKDIKINLIGDNQGVDGLAWKSLFSNVLNSYGAEVVTHYVKPYVYTPRERPVTHEVLKGFMNSGYHQKTSKLPEVSVLDKSWIAEHMKAARREEINLVKDCDLVLCYFDPDIFSVGAMEIFCYACLFKKPTFLVIPGGFSNIPIWLLGMIPHDYVFDSFKRLEKTLKYIDSGKISIKEDDYWGLYNKSYED